MHEVVKKEFQRQSAILLGALVVVAALCLQCIGAWQDSQTTDEAVHLSAGVSYWRTGDFRLNPEHPPLIKLLAAVPLLAVPQLKVDTESQAWAERNQWVFGASMIYGSFSDVRMAQTLMFLGRLPMILVWLVLALLLWWWACHRWGDWAGLVVVTFFAFDPNFLGHGHLVTTDLGATLGFFATIVFAERYWQRPTTNRLLVLSIIFALTQLTKFSSLLLWFIVPALGIIRLLYNDRTFKPRHWWAMIGALVVATSIVTWAVYGFEIKPIQDDPRIAQLWIERDSFHAHPNDNRQHLLDRLVDLTDPGTPGRAVVDAVGRWSIPAYSYWRGVFALVSHNYWGHGNYLLGEMSQLGWWYYFPVAMAVKTPIVTELMIILGLSLLVWRLWKHRRHQHDGWRSIPFSVWVYTVPPVIYLLWSLTSHINIGVRHAFPMYPFLFAAIGSLWVTTTNARWRHTLLTSASVLLVATTLMAWPNTIGYINAFGGGTESRKPVVLDSNLDWNQDIWRLRDWLDEKKVGPYHLALFGSIPAPNIFPEALPILTTNQVNSGQKPTDVIVISAGQLYNLNGPFAWLRPYQPTWRVGSSIYIYDFR